MWQLIEEYQKTKRAVTKYREELKERYPELDKDTLEELNSLLGSTISDLQFSIDYMRTGRVPGNRRGVHRLSYDKRTIPVDPSNLDYLRGVATKQANENRFDQVQQELLADYIATLTPREQEAFKLIKGQGISYGEAAKLMQVKKGTVQYYVKEAERKLTAIVQKPEDQREVQRVLFSEVI